MQGEKAVAVGLSLTLHACVAGMILARLAMAPGLLPETSVRVSIEAPAQSESSASAAPSEVIRPSGDAVSTPATAAPAPVTPSAPASPLAATLETQAPTAVSEPPAPTMSMPAAPLRPLPSNAVVAAQAGTEATPLAADAALDASTLTAEPLHAAPTLPANNDTPGATISEQAATSALPSSDAPAEPIALSQPTTAPSGPAPVLGESPAADLPSSPSAVTPTADAPPPALDRPAAPSNPVIADAGPPAMPDVTRPLSAPAIDSGETLAPPAPRQNAISASLAPPEQGTAIDLDAAIIPVPPADAARAQRIRAFVDGYDGGPCFFAAIRRISAAGAEIESFSSMPDTFRQFDRALKISTGVEPTVSGQRIWSAQCSAVDYLRQLPRGADAAPMLDLDRRELDRGDALSGTVEGAGGRPLRLFVISETGAVTDVSDAVSERNGSPAFSFRPQLTRQGGPFPQILVMVAGAGTTPFHPASVDDLFKPLMESKGTGYSVAAKMFLVTR